MSDQFPNGRPSGWIREQLDLIGKPADTPAPIATPEEVARAVAMRAARVFVRDVPDGWFVYEEVGAGDILLSRHETEFAARAARDLWIATEALSALKADNERLTRELQTAFEGMASLTRDLEAGRVARIDAVNFQKERNASLTEQVGKLREALSREQAHNANLRRTIEYAADRCADAAVHGTEEVLRAALTPTEPDAKETTIGDRIY